MKRESNTPVGVSRRSFNFGIAGFFGALFMPKGGKAAKQTVTPQQRLDPGEQLDEAPYGPYDSGANTVILRGKVVRKPVIKGYIRPDGSTGARASFCLAVLAQNSATTHFIPLGAWNDGAAWCVEHLHEGTTLTLQGRYETEDNRGYVVMVRAETPEARF